MFENREEAGFLLAQKLSEHRNSEEAVVIALLRGGIVVGKIVAENLHLPLFPMVVRKLSAPSNTELAIGAVASGVKFVDWELVQRVGVKQEYLDREIKSKMQSVSERIRKFQLKDLELKNKKVIILTDDGVATGATVWAAVKFIKKIQSSHRHYHQPSIILAVPVIARETYNKLKSEIDALIALEVPQEFRAVGQFYKEFPQVTDEEVTKLISDNI